MLQRVRYQDGGSLPKKTSTQTTFHPTEWKEVLAEAEKLFGRGEYEQALVWYHRGKRLRPKARDFHNGIIKCENAIANNTEQADEFDDDLTAELSSVRTYGKMTEKSKHTSKTTGTKTSNQSKRRLDTDMAKDVQHIMGLDKDRHFLKGLLTQIDQEHVGHTKHRKRQKSGTSTAKTRSTMATVVEKSLQFMDTRSVYWKQQMPLHIMELVQPPPRHEQRAETPADDADEGFSRKYAKLLSDIMKCNEDFLAGNFEKCTERTKLCIRNLKKYKSSEVNNKYEILGSLYSVLGNAYFELELYKEALNSYHKDLDIANEKDLLPSKSRALENMGRVYARVGEFDTAIRVWKEKLEMHGSAYEEAWLQHEVGYCYLAKKDFTLARQHGLAALALAEKTGDMRWTLNACLLIAQAQAKLREYELAHKYFTRAHDLACEFLDVPLAHTIEDAIDDTERAIKYSHAPHHSETNQQGKGHTHSKPAPREPPPARVESRLSVDHSVLAGGQDRTDNQSETASRLDSNRDIGSQELEKSKRVKIGSDTESVYSVGSKAKRKSKRQKQSTDETPEMPSVEKPKAKAQTMEYVAPKRTGKYEGMTLEQMRKEIKEAMENKKNGIEEPPSKPDKSTQSKSTTQKPVPRSEKKEKVEPKIETKPEPKPEPKSEPKPVKQHEVKAPSVKEQEQETLYEPDPKQEESLSLKLQQATNKQNKAKFPWKSRYKDVPTKNVRIYFKTGTTKKVKMAATQGAPDDEDSDEEYNDIVESKRASPVGRKRKGSPKKQLQSGADFTASDVAKTPYGPVITEFKSQRGLSFIKPPVSSINAVPLQGTFAATMQREGSFTQDGQRDNSPGRGLQREGSFVRPTNREASFVRPMQREGSFVKTTHREDSFHRPMQREGSFTKAMKDRSKPPPSPRKRGKTFYDNTESGSTYRSFDEHGPHQNTVIDNTPYSRNPREDSYLFSPSRLQKQKQAGLSQSLPSISYRKSHRRNSHSIIEEDRHSGKHSSHTKLPYLPKSGKTNVTVDSERSERHLKPHPRNEGGKVEQKPKERGDQKKMTILKMLLDNKN